MSTQTRNYLFTIKDAPYWQRTALPRPHTSKVAHVYRSPPIGAGKAMAVA